VKRIVESQPTVEGAGVKLRRAFGFGDTDETDPFLLFDDFRNERPDDYLAGFPWHPHRGIETITFAYKGSVEHHDSKGNHGVINPGDVQWMTAGGGVLHKEYHEQTFNRTGGAFEMLQLWINLPAKHKRVPAKYQSILHSKKPKVVLPNDAGTVHVVAGEYEGVKGIANAYSPIHMYDMHLKAGADVGFELPANYNTGILVVDGAITVNGVAGPENHYVQLKNEGGTIRIQAARKCILLVLSGEPLNEPYVNYGPFVMNTEEEIHEAIEDYKAGKFGFLAD
jgi:redox-sensitive bicupin YhaK (pirin superfamily)